MLLSVFCFSACNEVPAQESSSSSEKQENSIEFVDSEISLSIGDVMQLEVVTSKPNVYVFWSIRDTNIATVTDDGVITAIAEGQTICYAEFSGKTAMCLIKITEKGAEPMLSVSVPYANDSVTVYAGDTLEIATAVRLGDKVIEGAALEYATASDAVATVTDGILTGVAAGETTLSVTATYEGKTATATLSVTVVEK